MAWKSRAFRVAAAISVDEIVFGVETLPDGQRKNHLARTFSAIADAFDARSGMLAIVGRTRRADLVRKNRWRPTRDVTAISPRKGSPSVGQLG